jgi:hypothetical protein
MSFKDAVAADVKNVFINGLEFADEHDVDGNLIQVVIDDDVLDERSGRDGGGLPYADGVFRSMKRLYIAEVDLPRRPVKGELMSLDGEDYLIEKCVSNMGVLEIDIEANET